MKDELNANAARREQLEAQLAATEESPPLLHPEMARIYRTKVRELASASRSPMLEEAVQSNEAAGKNRRPRVAEGLVAGAGFEPATFGL
jgi:hypothetical protein